MRPLEPITFRRDEVDLDTRGANKGWTQEYLDTFTVEQASRNPDNVRKIFENHPFDPLRANINAVHRRYGEPLLYAALDPRRVDVVEYILERMSENDIRSCRDSKGNSALHIAAVAQLPHPDGSRYIVQKLVEKGADKKATNKAGESILYFAVSSRTRPADVEGVKYLLENGSLEQKDDWTLIVYKLVSLDGSDTDDWSGTTILPIIEMIMSRQFVDFYRKIRGGMSLAHYMAKEHELCNLTEIFDSFKKRHMNITRRDKSGKTLLELAYPSILLNIIFEIDSGQCYKNVRSIRFLLDNREYRPHECRIPYWTIPDRDADAEASNSNNDHSTLRSAQNITWYFARSNNDLTFTTAIMQVCKEMACDDSTAMRVLGFWSQNFLQMEMAGRSEGSKLTFREPSFNTHQEVAFKVRSVVLPYFDSIARSAIVKSKKRELHEKNTPGNIQWKQDIVYRMRQCQNSAEEIHDWVGRSRWGLPRFTDLSQKRSHQLSLEYEISFEHSISIHEPRTLDESYYTGLETDQLAERNKTQVVSQQHKKKHMDKPTQQRKKKHEDKPILMVPQLWLWSVDNACIMALPAESLGEGLYLTLKQQFDTMNPAAKECINGLLLAAIIMSICINSIERPYNAGLKQPLFSLFEKEIAAVSEEVRRYMDKGMETIHILRERVFISDIHDVRDELAMIRNVVSQQEEVWNAFWAESVEEIERDLNRLFRRGKQRRRSTSSSASGPDKSSNLEEPGLNDISGGKEAARAELSSIIGRPNTQLPRIKERIRKLDEDAERVEKWILVQLDLKSKHASLKASQAALDESHNSTTLSTAVIGFTIITVIFAPLSFPTSLFALPVDRFRQHQQNNAYPYGYIRTWLTVGEVASLTVTVIAVTASFIWLKMNQGKLTTQMIKTKFIRILISLKLMKMLEDDGSKAKDENDDSSTSDSDEVSVMNKESAKSNGKSPHQNWPSPLPKSKELGNLTESVQSAMGLPRFVELFRGRRKLKNDVELQSWMRA